MPMRLSAHTDRRERSARHAPAWNQSEQEPPPQHCDAEGFSVVSVSTPGALSSAISGFDAAVVSEVVSADMRSMLRLRASAGAARFR